MPSGHGCPRRNVCFSRILTALTEVLARDIRANDPGCPSQKLPLWAAFSFLTIWQHSLILRGHGDTAKSLDVIPQALPKMAKTWERIKHFHPEGGKRQKTRPLRPLWWFRELLPNLTVGYVLMLGRSAASQIIYVRPVGGQKITSNKGESPNKNHLCDPLDPHPSPPPPWIFCPHIVYEDAAFCL